MKTRVELVNKEKVPPAQALAMQRARRLFETWFTKAEKAPKKKVA